MTGTEAPEPLEWRARDAGGAVPVSRRFDDPYYSLDDGLAETRHTFLDGNSLRDRLQDGFHVAELGFGTGLNLLALMALWEGMDAPGQIRFTTFEAHALDPATMARAQAAFPALAPQAEALRPHLASPRFETATLRFERIDGDARETLPAWDGKADAWFLDGFSPAKNPQMWEADLMRAVARHTAPGGTAATYTAAGHVRRALAEAGFTVTRQPGYGRKRHMTVARL
ncbi:tRNA (5-methylaminomethyl-2-thiouridine)(34)-methyltransferase MnmD [Pseudaestuariivita atlantica]|uniref:FAD-dependent oxidoreductase n=1 Tax=Pseudaestuariivita atlantica TaxID=1317121 RepID=A0A0L1JT32_9RHOB|nr:tRNA (5-methylaminomethyl-2-thiouridine)(34)-methyltransferase MnmD [Pseudaestuariivita atlantica]KNG94867.1 FAD-dependent oxidoreductase [Pseudaestuariivita atlantica]